MAITRTQEVTVADAWANDDGDVSLEVSGSVVSVSIEEAVEFAVHVVDTAIDAARARDERDGERAIEETRERLLSSASALDALGGVS